MDTPLVPEHFETKEGPGQVGAWTVMYGQRMDSRYGLPCRTPKRLSSCVLPAKDGDGRYAKGVRSPNDEVFHGHLLNGKGLEGYTAQLVRNSRWLTELQQIHSVHGGHRPEAWQTLNHYIFWFHDNTFECIAGSFVVELRECSMPELLTEACRRLVR